MKNPYYPFSVEVNSLTSLKSLDGIYYRNNIDSYRRFKNWLIVVSVISVFIFALFIVFTTGWKQTLFATLLGGALSSIVWWISVIQTDEMNYRINQIDSVIAKIDGILLNIHSSKYYFIDGMKVFNTNSNDLYYRLINLLQIVIDLRAVKEINSDDLKLKWFDEIDISVHEFEEKIDVMLSHQEELFKKYSFEQLNDFVIYNEREMNGQLSGLKDDLLKRKGYILCGHAPIPADKVQERIDKANKFDKIFNNKRKD